MTAGRRGISFPPGGSDRNGKEGQEMGLSEIVQVQIGEVENSYVYEVSVKEACLGNITIVLSKTRKPEASSVIEGISQWYNSGGTVTVEKEKLKDLTDLYICLRDENTQVTGAAVKVYYEALSLKKWYLTGNRELVFLPDRGKSAYEFSDRIRLYYTTVCGYEACHDLKLPDSRIGLEQLDLWEESASFTFQLGYCGKDEGAEIIGACSPLITAYIAPPEISGIVTEEGTIVLSGDFDNSVPVFVRIYSGDQLLLETQIKDNKLDISGLNADEEEGITLKACYRTEQGSSFYSRKMEAVLKKPVIKSCCFQNGSGIVTMEEPGCYAIGFGQEKQTGWGRQFQIPEETREFEVRYVKGNAWGPPAAGVLSERAVYAFQTETGNFYFACDRPDGCSLTQDITTALSCAVKQGYEGTCFCLEADGEKAVFTMKKEIFSAQPEAVHMDYRNLVRQAADQGEALEEIREAVLEKLPMREEDFLFYYYDYCPGNGYTGIFEGMSLATEYTVYQNIPDAGGSRADLSGFTGTGTACYQVIKRNGKLTIEPFAGEMNFTVAPPEAMTGDNRLCGGAGVADMLYTGFCAEYMRLVYPVQFTERSAVGNLCYDRNICLLSSAGMSCLITATENMRKGGLPVNGVSYNYFRGRAVVVPKICVSVCGSLQWVSLGTRLLDVQRSMGLEKCSLYRRIRGERLCVRQKDGQMPLLAGDCIE